MKKNIFKLVVDHSFLYSALSLFFSVVFIHLIYIVLITPLADEQISISLATQSGLERTFPVILKDPEQEICLILFAWSLFLAFAIYAKNIISMEILNEGNIQRFTNTFFNQSISIENTKLVESVSNYLEISTSVIRYISWAIPSIGFLGTVRGIGEALGQADEAINGNIASMTQSLGVAFNSTFVALLLSIILMFVISRMDKLNDSLTLTVRSAAED